MLVLGCMISWSLDDKVEVGHRLTKGWKCFHAVTKQLVQTSVDLRLRLKLFESVVRMCVMLGLCSSPLAPDIAKKLDVAQIDMIVQMLRLKCEPKETWVEF